MLSTRSNDYTTERRVLSPADAVGRAGVFAQVMALVALTLAFAAAGGAIGRHLPSVAGLLFLIAAMVCVCSTCRAARRSESLAIAALLTGGLLLGLGLGPALDRYARADPQAVWQAAGATALLVGALGSGGYAIRRDLSRAYRALFVAVLAVLLGGVVAVATAMPAADLGYAIAGLVVFSGYTVVDFNLMRRAGVQDVVPLAAGIFIDIVNIFLLLLDLLGSSDG